MTILGYDSLMGVAYGLVGSSIPAAVLAIVALVLARRQYRLHPVFGLLAVPVAFSVGITLGVFSVSSSPEHASRFITTAIVAGSLGVFATAHGAQLGRELPSAHSSAIERHESLSDSATESITPSGRVKIRPAGEIDHYQNYPPLADELSASIKDEVWYFPADIPRVELERRLAHRLQSSYDLSKVSVTIDERGLAAITAAPDTKTVSRKLEDGSRSVTVSGLFPPEIESGDIVEILIDDDPVRADVLRVEQTPTLITVGETDRDERTDPTGPHQVGILTVAVSTTDADRLLTADPTLITVVPSGTNVANQFAAMVESDHQRIQLVDSTAYSESDPTLGVQTERGWQFSTEPTDVENVTNAYVLTETGADGK